MNRKGFRGNMLKYRVALSVIIAAILFLPSFAPAVVISNAAHDQENPHTIYLIDQGESGIWLTVWEDWRKDGAQLPTVDTGSDIYGRFINADGTVCGKEFVIAKAPENQTVPRAAYRQDPNDPKKSKVVVVWQDTRTNYVRYRSLSSIDTAAGCSRVLSAEKKIGFNHAQEFAFNGSKVSAGDELLGRMSPRIAYDQTGDRFWVVWKETRSILHQISELCFRYTNPTSVTWLYDDPDFIGYVRLDGSTLAEQPSEIDTPGADIIRNSDTTTARQLSGAGTGLSEKRTYESFLFANNPDVSCDDTSTQCLVVSEGERTKETLTCDCTDADSSGICDPGEVVTSTFTTDAFDDGFVHIYGIWDNYISLPVISSLKLDSGAKSAHYPAVGFDPISKRFLTAWEDLRGGANTKIYGQLLFSGGGFYNDNFIISYQDNDKDGTNDPNVVNSAQTKPFISYEGVNERFFVAWQDGRNGSKNLDIYGQKIDTEGTMRGKNFAIVSQSNSQLNPTIAYNDLTDEFLAVWKDARNAEKRTCNITAGAGTLQCGSDIYGQIFTLSGAVVVPKPLLNVSPASISFGDQVVGTTSPPRTVTITNMGAVGSSLTIKSIVTKDPFHIDSTDCIGKSLNKGASCTVNMVFNPTAFVTYSNTLTINSNDLATPAAKVTMSGTGIH